MNARNEGASTERAAEELVNTHMVEVLPHLGEQYPGELAMLRGVIRALRTAARNGDLAEVQRLLIANLRDEQGARENGARR